MEAGGQGDGLEGGGGGAVCGGCGCEETVAQPDFLNPDWGPAKLTVAHPPFFGSEGGAGAISFVLGPEDGIASEIGSVADVEA